MEATYALTCPTDVTCSSMWAHPSSSGKGNAPYVSGRSRPFLRLSDLSSPEPNRRKFRLRVISAVRPPTRKRADRILLCLPCHSRRSTCRVRRRRKTSALRFLWVWSIPRGCDGGAGGCSCICKSWDNLLQSRQLLSVHRDKSRHD